ncbi:hypothetical protein [Kitasatospora sp. GP82]|uniref:hypothetical protein n=1 Tax=Kitasatospora sp. GP82 TaxID=3035089 RepID=UPI002475DFEF|nr:hypothetical protein [Kitasatospora sp. GP82]MDH6124352.1 hypothetical protein [Kitasatospora sp. GP82]
MDRLPRPPQLTQLPQQDRADFELALGQALARDEIREALRRNPGLGSEQLRALARTASGEIAAAAADEYIEYLRVRSTSGPADSTGTGDSRSIDPDWAGGLMGVLAVLVPLLTGTAAGILLLLGYALGLAKSQRHLADSLLTAGWAAAVVAGICVVAGVSGLLATAARRRAAQSEAVQSEAAPGTARSEELERAREAWRTALLERGLLPFLLLRLQ